MHLEKKQHTWFNYNSITPPNHLNTNTQKLMKHNNSLGKIIPNIDNNSKRHDAIKFFALTKDLNILYLH